ncbi:Transcriptional repressor NF-X1 [Mactra antiquata]
MPHNSVEEPTSDGDISQNFNKILEEMDGQNYHYGYDPNQMFYVNDPNIPQGNFLPDPNFGSWGWHPPEYGSVHPTMHAGYVNQHQVYENYAQYPESASYGYQGYMQGSMQGRQVSRSKYSYSQNRTRNRQQRPDNRQSFGASNFNSESDCSNLNSNNNANAAVDDDKKESTENSKTVFENFDAGADQAEKTVDLENASEENTTASERNKNRGGRFMGSDSRSKQYNAKKDAIVRQRGYDKRFNQENTRSAVDRGRKQDVNDAGVNNKGKECKDSITDTVENGVKSRTSQDGRHHHGYRKEKNERGGKSGYDSSKFGSKTNKQYYDKSKAVGNEFATGSNVDDSSKTDLSMPNDKMDNVNESKENVGPGRRKKKEYHVYSSSSPREMHGSVQYNQKDAYDRYNFRGQDYNKRHKEMNTQSMEKGGDRTRLTINMERDKDNERVNVDRNNDEFPSANDYKKKTQGPHRGSRNNKKTVVDESQRGVLIEQLSKGTYECMVCCESVRSSNAVWNCTGCYHVFHLRCIKKWARSPNAVVSGTDRDGWRCPACQTLSFKFPNQYRCFCGKVRDPEVTRMDTPHSCGDVCHKDRGETCKHPCNLLCHPGPCPECVAMVTKSCDCGKTKQSAKCCQSTVIKCQLICERMLNCGRHYCQSKCHSGPCEKCEVIITQECYGEHEKREVICGSEPSFTASYSCQNLCKKRLDCGNHVCERLCHDGACDTCPLLPSNLTRCPCGAKSLTDISDTSRTTCLDPIPTCGAVCNKILNCGPEDKRHRCDRLCHEGPCGPCNGTTILPCRCLFMDKEYKCSELAQLKDDDAKFLCDKRCNRKKSCGRHKCGQSCCVKDEHICELICGRKLSCGQHKCMETCHKNNCPPCLMAGFDELTCHCGVEVMYPPIPCGTKPPECHQPCTRQHDCQHTVRHNCHSDEKCPPCTELTQKMCMGNHVKRSNIPCHLTDISCGMKCNKPLPCGQHRCIKTCHKGICVEKGQTCQQLCQQRRENCDHICGVVCHGEQPCPKTLCKAKVQVKCACGNREGEIICSNGDLSSDHQRLAFKDSIVFSSTSVNLGKFSHGKIGTDRVLDCDSECALLERNRRLASALDIQNPNLTSKLSTPVFSDFLKDFAKKDPSFVAGIEKILSELVQSAKQSKQAHRSHAFPCMKSNHRAFVHELAEVYCCQTQSYDNEPNKNVVATASRERSCLPSVTLTTMIQRGIHPTAPPPIPHVYKEDVLRQTNIASKQSTSLLSDRDSTSPEGWQVIGKKTKKSGGMNTTQKSAIATIDKFESDISNVCTSGTINYDSLSKASKDALKSEPVVDYFDFTVN